MREFGWPAGPQTRERILALAEAVFAKAEPKRVVKAGEFAMEEQPDRAVAYEVDVRFGEERLRVAKTEPGARPPFEWLVEITSDVGEADYFKHYLIRDEDVVLAQRKVLTPVDELEAKVIMDDLEAARAAIG